jgi:hypothetical protein
VYANGIKTTCRAKRPKSAGDRSLIVTRKHAQVKNWLIQSLAAFQAMLRSSERSIFWVGEASGSVTLGIASNSGLTARLCSLSKSAPLD